MLNRGNLLHAPGRRCLSAPWNVSIETYNFHIEVPLPIQHRSIEPAVNILIIFQIMENAEINNIIKIMGLQYKNKYETPESLRTLRYGKLMIMTDQDQDGSHIKGLLVNFIHNNWPNLLKHNFLEEFIAPIVKVTKGKDSLSFYSLPEFEQWKAEEEHHKSWKIKYYKGLFSNGSQSYLYGSCRRTNQDCWLSTISLRPFWTRRVISQDCSWFQDFLKISLKHLNFLARNKSNEGERNCLHCIQTCSFVFLRMFPMSL